MAIVELVIIFIAFPLLFYFGVVPVPKFIPLVVAFFYALIFLLRNKGFTNQSWKIKNRNLLKGILLRTLFFIGVTWLLTFLLLPDRMFFLPKKNLKLWVAIMLFYPIWSAFTQEVIFRPFFFQRYAKIFKRGKILIVINGLLFGFMHIIFRNWIAVAGAMVMGLVWAYTYSKHNSLLAVSIEHALVGNWIYTVGFGYFFYVPDFY